MAHKAEKVSANESSADAKPQEQKNGKERPAESPARPDVSPAAPAASTSKPAASTAQPAASAAKPDDDKAGPAEGKDSKDKEKPKVDTAPLTESAAPPAPASASDSVKDSDSAAAKAEAEDKAPEPETGGEKTGKTIDPASAHVLVVEDNVPNFVLVARLLAFLGVQRCEWKTSGWQVVEFADTLPKVDLILMDIRLPYEDGFEALEKVRSHPRLKDTLVIAVTAEASQEQMTKARAAGFDGFLGKPLDPDRFPQQVRRMLNGESVWELA